MRHFGIIGGCTACHCNAVTIPTVSGWEIDGETEGSESEQRGVRRGRIEAKEGEEAGKRPRKNGVRGIRPSCHNLLVSRATPRITNMAPKCPLTITWPTTSHLDLCFRISLLFPKAIVIFSAARCLTGNPRHATIDNNRTG